jgi:hypothetical protein
MSPRTWNRRSFNVTQNGFFTVLRPTESFSAARLPGGYRYVVAEPKPAAPPKLDENLTPASILAPEQNAPDRADGQPTKILLQILKPSEREHSPARPVLIALAAAAITGILLWCIQNP